MSTKGMGKRFLQETQDVSCPLTRSSDQLLNQQLKSDDKDEDLDGMVNHHFGDDQIR